MCGRYASCFEHGELADLYEIAEMGDSLAHTEPSWNVTPQQQTRIILTHPVTPDSPRPLRRHHRGHRSLQAARWGLVPSWAKDLRIGARMFNARIESVASKPAYRRALASRRCIIPANGYYEWQTVRNPSAVKTPYYFTAEDEAPLSFAGFYEFWRDPSLSPDDPVYNAPDGWLVTVTIITAPAFAHLAHVHHRRPIALNPTMVDEWLDPEVDDAPHLLALLTGPGPVMTARAISADLGSATEDGSKLGRQVETVGG